MVAAVAVVDVCGAGWPVLLRRLVEVLAGVLVVWLVLASMAAPRAVGL